MYPSSSAAAASLVCEMVPSSLTGLWPTSSQSLRSSLRNSSTASGCQTHQRLRAISSSGSTGAGISGKTWYVRSVGGVCGIFDHLIGQDSAEQPSQNRLIYFGYILQSIQFNRIGQSDFHR